MFLVNLPVEVLGVNVLGYLSLRDIVMLERASGSKKSYQQFLRVIPFCLPVVFSSSKHTILSSLKWFTKTQCKIYLLDACFLVDIPGHYVNNLQVKYFDLHIDNGTRIETIKPILESIGLRVRSIHIENTHKEVIEQLSVYTRNVKQLCIENSNNCMDCLSLSVLTRWKLTEINLDGSVITLSCVSLIVETCSELTSIKLSSDNVDDVIVNVIVQHCPKLETLHIFSNSITFTSLLALSEHALLLKELDIRPMPSIPDVDTVERCGFALSRLSHINTQFSKLSYYIAPVVLSYMTGLTSVRFEIRKDIYIPLLTQYCNNFIKIEVSCYCYVNDLLSLCQANPLLKELHYHLTCYITDSMLIELIHACPHLHTLYLPYDTIISDKGLLALSEHCPQLQELVIYNCHSVTETAVLQLLQRCRKLSRLEVSSSSLSEKTWTQLERYTKKRVSRW